MGYHPLWHRDVYRPELDALFGDQPVILWHRSFHELILDGAALAWAGLSEAEVGDHPQIHWERGHFFENGAMRLVGNLAPLIFDTDRYLGGMKTFLEMLHRASVTTALDMGIGIFGDPVGEAAMIRRAVEETRPPSRLGLTPIITDFLARGIEPDDAIEAVEQWRAENIHPVTIDRRLKLMLDSAIFSGLAQYGPPGYLDGHRRVWMAPPEVTTAWAERFWAAGFQLHAHTNGDLSTDLFIDILRRLQDIKPRPDHRMTLEHFAYSTEDQNRQLRTLGAQVSANPYYVDILSDLYSEELLGRDRGSQMVRLGSLERLGVAFSLHSDCPMAPLSPLALAASDHDRFGVDHGVGERDRIRASGQACRRRGAGPRSVRNRGDRTAPDRGTRNGLRGGFGDDHQLIHAGEIVNSGTHQLRRLTCVVPPDTGVRGPRSFGASVAASGHYAAHGGAR